MAYPRLLIAGTHSGVGKTTVTLALMAAFTARGRTVQPFKVGPDFIDPSHHRAACGRETRNLDGWMLDEKSNRATFLRAAQTADLSLIEGVMGLFDGSTATGEKGSTAEQSKRLGAPVLLVVDGSAMARSAAALVHGFATFDPDVRVAGVVFNRVRTQGHFRLLKEAVETALGIPAVGYFPPDDRLSIPERHLGLHMARERETSDFYTRLGVQAEETMDLDRIEQLARSGSTLTGIHEPDTLPQASFEGPGIRVGVADDPAFCFYYADNLDRLVAEGATLVRFSPLHDPVLPKVDLVYLGGGYPELYARALAANDSMRQALKDFADRGGVIYAECGGLMYLTERLWDFDGVPHDMVGLFPAEVAMTRDRLALGYRELAIVDPCPLGDVGLTARGHEFHYSTLDAKGPLAFGCRAVDAQGRVVGEDGLLFRNVVALYTHLHFGSQPGIPRSLVQQARAFAKRRSALTKP